MALTKAELESLNDKLSAEVERLEALVGASEDSEVEGIQLLSASEATTITMDMNVETGSFMFHALRDGRVMHHFDGMKEQDLTDDPMKGY